MKGRPLFLDSWSTLNVNKWSLFNDCEKNNDTPLMVIYPNFDDRYFVFELVTHYM